MDEEILPDDLWVAADVNVQGVSGEAEGEAESAVGIAKSGSCT